jgi:alpha-tubulin suppressor-like RCC1 family protein
VRYVWIAAALAAGLVGCENGPSNPPEVDLARSVRILQGDTTLRRGATAQLAGEVLDASGGALPGLRPSWSSNDPHIASVDSTGLVSAVTPGAALVVASYRELSDTVAITVLPPPVVALGVWPDTNVLFTGMTRTLLLSVVRGSASSDEPAQSWSTSDASVATVENGVVTAVGTGHATVTARLEDQVSPPIHVFVMPAPSPALRFSTGSGTCGLTTDGVLYCWGSPFPGMAGPFDRCRTIDRFGIHPYRCSEIPRLVSADLRFKALAGDVSGGCAVTVDGALYCWGGNRYGGLGLGFKDDVTRGLTRVRTDGEFVEVAGGFFTRCARRIDGVILCWGWNFRGDAGIGSLSPTEVTEPTPINTSVRFLKVSPGGNCGLAADSTAYCWGSFVGDVAFEGCNTACNPSPVQVKLEKLVDLGTSGTYCGIGVSGRAYCWGFHGASDPYRYAEPQEIPNPGIRSFERGLYAVDGSGAVFHIDAWGALWRFRFLDTGALRYKRYWGDCGIALDDKLYCGTRYGGDGRLMPGQ